MRTIVHDIRCMTPCCLSANAPDERDTLSATAPIPRISMVPPSVPKCIPRRQRTRLVAGGQIKPQRTSDLSPTIDDQVPTTEPTAMIAIRFMVATVPQGDD